MYKKYYKFDLLSHDLELRLWDEFPAEKRVQILVETHLRLIFKIAKRYRNLDIPMEDLVQEGIIGIIKAAERYEPGPDRRFCSYAKLWIQGMMQNFIVKNWSIVKNASLGQKKLFLTVSQQTQKQIDDFSLRRDFSLNEFVTTSQDEFIDLYTEEEESLFEVQYMEEQYLQHLGEVLEEVMVVLTPIEKEIIMSRFFHTELPAQKFTTGELGRIEGVAIRKMYRFFNQNIDMLRKIYSWL